MVGKGIDQFSKGMNNFSLNERQTNKNARRTTRGLEKLSGIDSSNRYAGLVGSSKSDYTTLTGRTNNNVRI